MFEFAGSSGQKWVYDRERPLGDPGRNAVFEGFNPKDPSVQVAVKEVSIDPTGSGSVRRWKEREIEIGKVLRRSVGKRGALEHVMIPIDFGYRDSSFLVVMPRGHYSLRAVIGDHRFGWEERIEAIRQIAMGLMELANISVLHRDIKPANILWIDGRWKIADFDISRNLAESTGTFSYTGSGTWAYMAPEIWEKQSATVKSDLYSFGIMMYEALVSARPFKGSERELQEQHAHAVAYIPDFIPPRLGRILVRLLRKDPAERYQDARAVLEGINAYLKTVNAGADQLQQAAMRREERRADKEASRMAVATRADQLEQLTRQAIGDLAEIMTDAMEEINDSLPEATLAVRTSNSSDAFRHQWEIVWETSRLKLGLWNAVIQGNHLAGEVHLRRYAGQDLRKRRCRRSLKRI